jgi:hypothetical protein
MENSLLLIYLPINRVRLYGDDTSSYLLICKIPEEMAVEALLLIDRWRKSHTLMHWFCKRQGAFRRVGGVLVPHRIPHPLRERCGYFPWCILAHLMAGSFT